MSVNVTVIDRATCNSPDYYNSDPVITKGMICAGSDGKKQTDTCGVRTLCAGGKQPVIITLTAMYVQMTDDVFLLTLGGFRRTTGVSRSTGRSHFFWKAMWPNKKAGSVRVSLWKTAQVDQKHDEEVWDAISPLRSTSLSLFFCDTFYLYSLLALCTYIKSQGNSAKCRVISTQLIGVGVFCSWFLVMRNKKDLKCCVYFRNPLSSSISPSIYDAQTKCTEPQWRVGWGRVGWGCF